MFVATLPTGHIGFVEVPITNEKPKYYQVNDNNTLISNVTHTYKPDITEQFVPYHHFYLHQVYITNSDTPSATSFLYNVQPTSNNSKHRDFPPLPYSKKLLNS